MCVGEKGLAEETRKILRTRTILRKFLGKFLGIDTDSCNSLFLLHLFHEIRRKREEEAREAARKKAEEEASKKKKKKKKKKK